VAQSQVFKLQTCKLPAEHERAMARREPQSTNAFVERQLKNDKSSPNFKSNQGAGELQRPVRGNMWLHLKWRVIQQRHMDKIVAIRYIHTSEQLADIPTKAFTPMIHERLFPC
jgi:hypothetical protein